ncbi:MAG: UvrD-helicase domain-containing protein [Bacilli bacterium]|nr:UvrD-helicase domain-containing protein [Bacilli bacterium]
MIPAKPKDVIWSDEQWRAIHEHGCDILINAGAGSGKTAVLTERIIEIIKKGIDIDRLIVLTFTKAAAAEMKERLRRRLQKEVASGAAQLNAALEGLDQAAIQTFDSFTLSLVRRYHYLLGVDRSINIGDQVIFNLKKKQVISEVFAELYCEENTAFHNLIDLFAIKNDTAVEDYIYTIDEKLEMLADKDKFLLTYLPDYYRPEFISKAIKDFTEIIKIEVERIKQRLHYLRRNVTEDVLYDFLEQCENSLSGLLTAQTYQDFLCNCDVKLPATPRRAESEDERQLIKYQRDLIVKNIKSINSFLQYQSQQEMFDEIMRTKGYAEIIIEIIGRVDRKMFEFKRQVNCYSYNDIAKMAIKIFAENPHLCEKIKKNTYEILIDEYQDTNDIQERLISYIASGNVYMVGDIKQSIYRFRNANPDIFREKYYSFQQKKIGIPIDLSKNFRSRQEVINGVNLIFSQVMSTQIGGVDYHDGHALIYGNKSYSDNCPEPDYRVALLAYEPLEGYRAAEAEAFMVARDIKDKISGGYQIYDKDKKKIRPAAYGDFTILSPEKKNFDLYKQIFEHLQIPLMIHKDEGFVKSGEIYVIKNILHCVLAMAKPSLYGDRLNASLISVLRSFVVSLPDELIARIYRSNPLDGLKSLCPGLYCDLINMSHMVEKATSSEILTEIYRIFNIFEKMVQLGNVEQTENKLNFLIEKFYELDKIGYCLADAVNYLEVMTEQNLDFEVSRPVTFNQNVVNMMTIHKSKGLEFPVCYYVDTETNFKYFDVNSRVLFSRDYGIVLPVFNEGLKDTFYKQLVKQKFAVEEISERIRLFYVALTRAKEKIIIVAPKLEESYKEDTAAVSFADRLNYKSFYSLLSSIEYSLRDLTALRTPVSITAAYRQKPDLPSITVPAQQKIEKRQIKTERIRIEKDVASSPTTELLNREMIAVRELGTKIHRYLEIIDFTGDLRKQIEMIKESPWIKRKIEKFFRLPIFTEKAIVETYHEHQFTYTKDNITVNGVIDLILETETELLVIDYKLSDIDKEEYRDQLKVYCQYLSSISNKKIRAYLYSIYQEKLRQIL